MQIQLDQAGTDEAMEEPAIRLRETGQSEFFLDESPEIATESFSDVSRFVRAAQRREPTADDIRRRAHQIYLARAGAPGNEVLDWLIAELELRAEFRRAARD
ncbi:MAG: DUF2934 domain-containing protein [Phycisphaerales bacterium]|nr:DUF2934 domain-containing protein [Phycisphaerales bacterium]